MQFFLAIPYERNFNRHLLKVILHILFPLYYEKPPINSMRTLRKVPLRLLAESAQQRILPRKLNNALRHAEFRLFRKNRPAYDYGLSMQGCFDGQQQTINQFLDKHRKHHDLRSLHYLFHLSYLQRLDMNLDHLHPAYRI
jgi:hypothetical protein